MTSRSLPERPNLEQLKNQAKSLLHAAQAKDPIALRRFLSLPAFTKKAAEHLNPEELALHDAQSVIAREHGFASWKALREHVEERSMSFAAAVDEFVRCATGGAAARAFRLLELHPGIAHASLHTALVLGDVVAVEAHVQKDPAAATRRGGIQAWEPIQYVCHTCLAPERRERADGLVAIARRLLALGANPNAAYHWRWHPELPRTVLWGAICAVAHLPLAEVLLEAGANPTDGVCVHIAGGGGNLAALELLHRFGMNVNGIPGGVPPLVYMMHWGTNPAGPRWLLEHGADPNLAWGDSGEAPLHVAARRWDVTMAQVLVQHGADLHRRRADGLTPLTVAELHGNRAVATWLREHGAIDELTPLQRFIAACARGDRGSAETQLRERSALRAELLPEHHLMLHGPAERGDLAVLETMLACGFDPNAKDRDGVTALHRAAREGHAEAVRLLIAHGAAVDALDNMFFGTPLIWATDGWSEREEHRARYPAVARLLMAAGSPLDWRPQPDTPGPERIFEALAELRRAAAALTDH